MLPKGFERNDRNGRIDIAHGPTQQAGGWGFTAGRERAKSHKIGDVTLKSLSKWNVNRAVRIIFEERMPRRRHNPDNLHCFVGLNFAAEIGAHAHRRATAAFRAGGIIAGELDALAE